DVQRRSRGAGHRRRPWLATPRPTTERSAPEADLRRRLGASGLVPREHHPEQRAAARVVLDLDAATVILDDAGAHGEAQAGALAGRLGGEEGLEDALAERLGDTRPAVAHLDGDAVPLDRAGDHRDGIALALERVREQVDEDLL